MTQITSRCLNGSRHGASLCGVVAAVMLVTPVQAQLYDFTINPAQSGLNGSLSFAVPTSGTLIGNWDPVKMPGGTRTKPGLFGTFDPTENLPVPASLTPTLGGPINSSTSGTFRMSLNPGNSTALVSAYNANFLHSGAVSLPVILNLLYDSFRTRAPDSIFVGGVPLPIPFGEASLTQLRIQQVSGGEGVLKKTGPDQYDFFVTPIVQLTAEFTILGQPLVIPGAPTPFALEGQVTVLGATALLSSVRAFEFNDQFPVNQPLPQLPFELPTILPPGGTAQLLMDLTIGTVTAGLNATGTTNASGILVPAPAAWALVAMGGLVARRRKR